MAAEKVISKAAMVWEIINLLTFICEEACQSGMMGAGSALNKGNIGLAEEIVEKGVKEALGRLTQWNALCFMFMVPSAVPFTTFTLAVMAYIADADTAIRDVQSWPGRTHFRGFTKHGRFF